MRFPEPTAPDLDSWRTGELAALTAPAEPGADGPVRPLRLADLLLDDAAALRAAHRRLREENVTPQAAATYLAGWFAGGIGHLIGLGLVSAGAGLVLNPDSLVFDVVDEGWPEEVRPGPLRAFVAPSHRWAGGPDVEVVPAEDVVPRTLAALAELVRPVIEACRGLARVSRSGPWDEVIDSLVGEVAYTAGLKVTPAGEELLRAAVATPGMPWKARPRLVWVDSPVVGRMLVAQKGGCCLAFTNRREPTPESELSPALLEFRRRFGLGPPGKRYCTTCSFRDTDDVVARRVAWAEIRHLHRVS